jgi:hypothetical protein
LLIGLSFFSLTQHNKVQSLKYQITLKDNELTSIVKQAADYTARINNLQDKVKEDQKVSLMNSQRILSSHVSDNCNDSMAWAINQSGYLR